MKPSFADMTQQEFDSLIDSYIDRTATQYGEMPAKFFLDLLLERINRRAEQTLTFTIKILNNNLAILPEQDSDGILVHGNEILIGKHRLVLQLA